MSDDQVLPPSPPAYRALLADFFANNPSSSLDTYPKNSQNVVVANPWGDPSIGLLLVDHNDELIDVLNNVYLPERFTAIWHLDTKKLEIIFTADAMPPAWADLPTRSFQFTHKGHTYDCAYGDSSHRLEIISSRAMPRQPSRSAYRNLMSFQRFYFARSGIHGIQAQPNAIPYSFWVDGLEWNDDIVVDVVQHLNFYMSYYDNISPMIIMHSPEQETAASKEVTRYPLGPFPQHISGRPVDESLLQFWLASREGDPVRRYIYNYQIIEYAAAYHIEEGVKRTIRRSIAVPHALGSLDRIAQQIIDAMSEMKMQNPQQIETIIRHTVDPALLWPDLEKDSGFFSQVITFEGGFQVQPISKVGWTIDDFKVNWCPAFPNTIRLIRNALSHGRERTGAVILPTVRNFRLLQAWVPLVATAAREVMIYRDTT